MANYKLMSNNLWKTDDNQPAWIEKGWDCCAEIRGEGFAKVYASVLPDIIGLQESSERMIEKIMSDLDKAGLPYALLEGKDTPIIYRKDKFEVLDYAFHLYSKTIEGLEGEFNNGNTKSYTIALFREKEENKTFVFATTHLWWMSSNPEKWHYYPNSDEAREHQIKLVANHVIEFSKKYNCPAVVVGDFNTTADSKAVQYLLNNGYDNAHDRATDYACSDNGTHPCGPKGVEPYEPKDFSFAIDHLFVKGEDITVKKYYRFISKEYEFLSDHFPVLIDVEI